MITREKVLGFYTDAGLHDLVERITNPIEIQQKVCKQLVSTCFKNSITVIINNKDVYHKSFIEPGKKFNLITVFSTKFDNDDDKSLLSVVIGQASEENYMKLEQTKFSDKTVITNIL
jgi:hypothetical protein